MTMDKGLGDARGLILIRHAQAGDAMQFIRETGQPDHFRPLTAKGIKRNAAAALGLRQLGVPIDQLWSSPLCRAEQTAAGIAEVYGIDWQSLPDLQPPWNPSLLGSWLEARVAPGQVVALVGHEPDLSSLLDYWLFGRVAFGGLEMKKGSMAMLMCPVGFGPGALTLNWLLPQSLLCQISGKD